MSDVPGRGEADRRDLSGHAEVLTRRSLWLLVSLIVMACSETGFPAGTVLVIVNRTTTPIVTGVGIVQSCDEVSYDQHAIDVETQRMIERGGPKPPDNAVDLTNVSLARPIGAPAPTIAVITRDGSKVSFGALDRDALPVCGGEAKPLP